MLLKILAPGNTGNLPKNIICVSNSIKRQQTISGHELDVRGSVHHSSVRKENQQDATVYQNVLVRIYMKLNMFRATHRPSSGA